MLAQHSAASLLVAWCAVMPSLACMQGNKVKVLVIYFVNHIMTRMEGTASVSGLPAGASVTPDCQL